MSEQSTLPQAPPPGAYTPPVTDPGKTLGIVGFVFAFLIPLVGIICSLIARSRSKKAGFKNTLATAGIWVSVAIIILGGAVNAALLN
ncbi:DUF4190 domain-containing protein [Xylanimonas sp. McL0601]|uniref:DUF4190 domain-containing protein n=1 Tax=Xylanimonas sp. McL0601 TaxID=3414739 RepID=UPI003CEFFBBC